VRRFIAEHESYLSVVSEIEVLGYHKLATEHRQKLEKLFEIAMIIPITEDIVETAITLRQQRKMSLGDSIIAATAVVHGMTLATANIHDFEWIENLQLINPVNPAK
jgi:predicted nucleic acid-binding protein